MKKILTAFFILVSTTNLFAEEGMWLPILLKQLNEADMQAKGLKLSAEEIYSVNKTSLKDAVVLFGGGCTGAVISNEGLMITNHHCGASNISSLSTLEKNYLRDGFWAKSKEDEIPSPGASVTFIISMTDVTNKIMPNLDSGMTEYQRSIRIKELSAILEKEVTNGTHYTANVRSFYYGTVFYLFVTETFKDIRLVGTPPNSVGDFGGETDNWVWPRHTGDFSMFRIYAGADNKPAAYSKDNKPFKPRYFFPINVSGVKDGDFTMVYGFPGSTQQYIPSDAVDMIMNVSDPNKVLVREKRLDIINNYMSGNDTITLMYSSKIRRLKNAYKKWKGEMLGLKVNDAVGKKKTEEQKFQQWTTSSAQGKPYSNLLTDFKNVYEAIRPVTKVLDFTNEAAFGIELMTYSANFKKLIKLCDADTTKPETIKAEGEKLLKNSEGFFKNYYLPIDKKVFAALMHLYFDSVPSDLQPPYFKQEIKSHNYDFTKWADDVFSKSMLVDHKKVMELLTDFDRKKVKKIKNDVAYKLWDAINFQYELKNTTEFATLNEKLSRLQRDYMVAQRAMLTDKKFYPDANLTLRVAYGNVKGYFPRDGVYYDYQTYSDGILEKNSDGEEDFEAPKNLIDLFKAKNFGPYGVNGKLPVSFIATNHSTGGNSGSPVINAKGELLGLNYDRVWEGTMSDILYDINRCRNITLDIRYILFLIDKFGGATNIIDELKIVKSTDGL